MTADELRTARETIGLSQAALARRLGIPANTLARWERGEVPIRHGHILALALQHIGEFRPCIRCGIATAAVPLVVCPGCYDATTPRRQHAPSCPIAIGVEGPPVC